MTLALIVAVMESLLCRTYCITQIIHLGNQKLFQVSLVWKKDDWAALGWSDAARGQ